MNQRTVVSGGATRPSALLVARGEPCPGPVTKTSCTGCGVLCPSYDRPCYSCFGPAYQPNTASPAAWLERLGFSDEQIQRMFHAFYSQAPEFQIKDAEHHAGPDA